MNREQLKQILPHREPMLLVDESELDGAWVHSKYHVRGDEFFLQGHFPGYPVVPGVILCEIMAQSSVLLVGAEELKTNTAFYAGLEGVKFRKSVFPGDTVCVDARISQRRGPAFIIEAKASVDGAPCCSGSLKIMLVPNESLKK